MPKTLMSGMMLFILKSQRDIAEAKSKAILPLSSSNGWCINDAIIQAEIKEINRQIVALDEYEQSPEIIKK